MSLKWRVYYSITLLVFLQFRFYDRYTKAKDNSTLSRYKNTKVVKQTHKNFR